MRQWLNRAAYPPLNPSEPRSDTFSCARLFSMTEHVTRRNFLRFSGGVALTATAGCDRMAPVLSQVFKDAKAENVLHPPKSDAIDMVSHHLNRLSFGPRPDDYERVRKLGGTIEEAVQAYLDEQLHPERIDDSEAERRVARLETLRQPLGELFEFHGHVLLRELVHGTVLRAVYSRRQLYEVMVQFWTDHFNIDPSKGDCQWLKAWDDREVIRRYALGYSGEAPKSLLAEGFASFFPPKSGGQKPVGRFLDLVRASALSPAMLWYLDGRENRKRESSDKPNENYARELLELHTLGVHGGYTQKDVMEVARCLTGWTVRAVRRGPLRFKVGKVEFNARLHDDGPKEVLGNRLPAGLGAQDLDRVLEIVSTHPSTAGYIATKLCRRFISDEPPASAIRAVQETFLKSEGDIRATLGAVFGTEEFRQARGLKFKRPFNYVVSALRATDAEIKPVPNRKNDGPLYQVLRSMGHAPFDYPTPDGYPEEAAPWLGTLLWRWHFALALTEGRIGEARVDAAVLRRRLGGDEGMMRSLLGRIPTEAESEAGRESGASLALMLASPAFQWS